MTSFVRTLASYLYTYIDNQGQCVYCGEPEECTDHFVPVSKFKEEIFHDGFFVLPSCTECNQIAWAHKFRTVHERQAFIHYKIKKKYAKLLRMPNWTEHEIGEMGCNAQTMIRVNLEKRNWVRERLQWTLERNFAHVFVAAVLSESGASGRDFAKTSAERRRIRKKGQKHYPFIGEKKEVNREFALNLVREFGEVEALKVLKEVKK